MAQEMPADHDMLSQRIDRFEESMTNSINKMSESINTLATLMAEKTANDRHVEEKLEKVADTQAKQDKRLRQVEDYITSKSGMQKYLDFFWRAVITVGATAVVGGVAWATVKSMGLI